MTVSPNRQQLEMSALSMNNSRSAPTFRADLADLAGQLPTRALRRGSIQVSVSGS